MRCINCNVDLHRLRRHSTSSLSNDLLNKLAGWLTIEVPIDTNICHACFDLLNSDVNKDGRLFGHTMLCVACGRSVRLIQQHVLESDHSMLQHLPRSHPAFHQVTNTNYACHRCWMRHERQHNQDLNRAPRDPSPVPAAPESIFVPAPEPSPEPKFELSPEPSFEPSPDPTFEPSPEPTLELSPEPAFEPSPEPTPAREPEINLPNYKRAANTSARCVFRNCAFRQQLHVIPIFIKKMLIDKHKFYIPRSTRVCETHLSLEEWDILLENTNHFSNFTANQIEDIINIAISVPNIYEEDAD